MGELPWLILIVVGLVLEAVGLRRRDDRWPPLTDVIRRHAPKWAIAMAIGWLWFHFLGS
jgi:hypothetical protein